jgi:hypothetical protein
LGGDLESETEFYSAKTLLVVGIRVKEGQTAGPARPARRIAEHEMTPKPETSNEPNARLVL